MKNLYRETSKASRLHRSLFARVSACAPYWNLLQCWRDASWRRFGGYRRPGPVSRHCKFTLRYMTTVGRGVVEGTTPMHRASDIV